MNKGKYFFWVMVMLIGIVTFVNAQSTEKFTITFNSDKSSFTIKNSDDISHELILRVKYRCSEIKFVNGVWNGKSLNRWTETVEWKIKLEPRSFDVSPCPGDNYIEVTILDWV